MWLAHSWTISQLSCWSGSIFPHKNGSPNGSCDDTILTTGGQKSHSFLYESIVIGGTLDIASRTIWQLCQDSGHVCHHYFTRGSSSAPCFLALLVSMLKSVLRTSVWLLISCIHSLTEEEFTKVSSILDLSHGRYSVSKYMENSFRHSKMYGLKMIKKWPLYLFYDTAERI